MFPSDPRPGEVPLPFDPAASAADAAVVFLGRLRSSWRSREECPKNLREARERGIGASIEIDEPWRQGLAGIEPGNPLIVLYWMNHARRDLIVQAPRHSGRPAGVFALRSPVRPNPIALAVVKCLALDREAGIVSIDAIDALDRTPVLDIKPWLATVDAPPGD
jgi:tRNA-Thr(GGU) m(6)t(6)A37 methyltransferase TsaA